LFDELDIVVADIEVLIGDVVADPQGIGSAWRNNIKSDEGRGPWDGGDSDGAVWSFPPLLRLIDWIRGMWERVKS
jgi:hypothetical protein